MRLMPRIEHFGSTSPSVWEGLLKQIKETAPRKKSEVADNQQRVASL